MTPQEKAMELYPDRSNADLAHERLRKCFIEACEWYQSELSGTPEEAEEVLKGFEWYRYIQSSGEFVPNKDGIIKAMQEMYARGRAKAFEDQKEFIKHCHDTETELTDLEEQYEQLKSDSVVEIQSLQAELEGTKTIAAARGEAITELQQQLGIANTTIYTQRQEITKQIIKLLLNYLKFLKG